MRPSRARPARCGWRAPYRRNSRQRRSGRLDPLPDAGRDRPPPADPIALDEKQEVTKLLLACGASIHEINAVRKHISQIKGGQLARLAYPAQVLSLLLSDVIGDNLDVIGSGPTAPDASTFALARAILDKYGILQRVPASIRERIERGC